METWRHEHGEWRHGHGDMETKSKEKWQTVAQAIFLNPFTVCSLCKQKLVVRPFVDEETNGSYLFSNGLKSLNRLSGLNGLAHLCMQDILL
jgi:hypothetical protein